MKVFRVVAWVMVMMAVVCVQNVRADDDMLTICSHAGKEPYIIQSAETIRGIDLEVMMNILERHRQSARFEIYAWTELLERLREGRCDIGFSLFDLEQHRDHLDFAYMIPMHFSAFEVLVPKGQNVTFNRVSDFFGKTVGHHSGFSLTIGFEQAIRDGRIARVHLDGERHIFEALFAGYIDVIIDRRSRLRFYAKENDLKSKLDILQIPFMPHRPAFMAFSKKSDFPGIEELSEQFAQTLKDLYIEGIILDIQRRYLG